MIFGDPYRFAVLIQHLPEWSDDTYKMDFSIFVLMVFSSLKK